MTKKVRKSLKMSQNVEMCRKISIPGLGGPLYYTVLKNDILNKSPSNNPSHPFCGSCWIRWAISILHFIFSVNGQWAQWGAWGDCDAPCGRGVQRQERLCTLPAPRFGGAECEGNGNNTQACNTHACPSKCIHLFICSIQTSTLKKLCDAICI